jgi:hypothetical protein
MMKQAEVQSLISESQRRADPIVASLLGIASVPTIALLTLYVARAELVRVAQERMTAAQWALFLTYQAPLEQEFDRGRAVLRSILRPRESLLAWKMVDKPGEDVHSLISESQRRADPIVKDLLTTASGPTIALLTLYVARAELARIKQEQTPAADWALFLTGQAPLERAFDQRCDVLRSMSADLRVLAGAR